MMSKAASAWFPLTLLKCKVIFVMKKPEQVHIDFQQAH